VYFVLQITHLRDLRLQKMTTQEHKRIKHC